MIRFFFWNIINLQKMNTNLKNKKLNVIKATRKYPLNSKNANFMIK